MKHFFIIVFMAVSATAIGQQLQTSSLYELQGILHNPSMAGSVNKGIAGINYRTQWTGISGRPVTATAFGSFDIPKHKIALGGYLYTDQTGPTRRTGIELVYAKYIPMGNDARLSFGIEARGVQFSVDRQKLEASLGSDPVLGSGNSKMKFDAGFGMSYISKNFQIGVSAAQLIQTKLGFYSGNSVPSEEAKLYRHYYLHGAYNFHPDEEFVITPYFMMIYLPNAPTEFVGGVKLQPIKWVNAGFAVRSKQSVVLTAGVNPGKNFNISYAFDVYRTPYSVFEQGANAHELMLRYNFL